MLSYNSVVLECLLVYILTTSLDFTNISGCISNYPFNRFSPIVDLKVISIVLSKENDHRNVYVFTGIQ